MKIGQQHPATSETAHAHAFPEWREVSPAQPIRQGDILTSMDEASDAWRQTVVIITADCDLAHDKYGGSLTCIPVLDVEDYVLRFRLDKQRDSLLSKVNSECIRIYQSAAGEPNAVEIAETRLAEWIVEAPNDEIVSELGMTGATADRFGKLLDAARILQTTHPTSVLDAASMLTECKLVLGHGTDANKVKRQVAEDLASNITKLPGDALFINEISEIHTSGYVAYLRRIVELRDTDVATTVSQASTGATHIRVSRLTSPYIHALSQQFGSVFSAIGLPVAYEDARAEVVKRISTGGIFQ